MAPSDLQVSSYRLLERIERVCDWLTRRSATEPAYQELIEALTAIGDRLKSNSKLAAKIVSPTAAMASVLKTKSEARSALTSIYDFEAVSPVGNIRSILQNCDLVCLVYLSHHEVRPHHRKLIELARQEQVDVLILVSLSTKVAGAKTSLSEWLATNALDAALLPLSEFIDPDSPSHINLLERSLLDLAPTIRINYGIRIEGEIERELKRWFDRETNSTWQQIRDLRAKYLGGVYVSVYQQQLRQNISQIDRFKQQLIGKVRQEVNYAKADLLNPFTVNSLIYQIQQLIEDTQVKTVSGANCTYLYLVLPNLPEQPYLHDYISELCQQKTAEILAWQWSQILTQYGSGGIMSLRNRLNEELQGIEVLLPHSAIVSEPIACQTADFGSVIEPECLEFNSRIVFDYRLTQSSWFRLLISVLIGIVIYCVTWLFSGTGRYIGFVIIIFQIINLIAGQNVRQTKLKQQTKELRRLVERNYQSLVRIMVAHIAQTALINLDRQCQIYQEEWQTAIATAQQKLDELKQESDLHKTRVDRLNQDKQRLRDLFE